MSKSQRLTTTFLNNLKPNPTIAKSTDYEVNLSAMKDSGLPTGVRCIAAVPRILESSKLLQQL